MCPISLAKCKRKDFAHFAHADWDISSAISPLFMLSQGEIALRDGLGCAVIQVYHFASGAWQGSLQSRQVKPQSTWWLVLSLWICHCRILHAGQVQLCTKLRFDSYKRRRKVDERKKLVCPRHCHRHHHHHHQKQDVVKCCKMFECTTRLPRPHSLKWQQ